MAYITVLFVLSRTGFFLGEGEDTGRWSKGEIWGILIQITKDIDYMLFYVSEIIKKYITKVLF